MIADCDALVLGWAGSSERQVRGMAGFYERAGARVITARADVLRAMGLPRGWREEGERLAPRLRGERPLIVHLFSNAGFWLWAATLEAMRPEDRARVSAVILDSAPGVPPRIEPGFYAKYSARAMMPLVLAGLGRRPRLTHPVLTPPLWAFMRLWYHLSGPQIRFAERSLEIVAGVDAPHLLLYAEDDSLVRPVHVEAFARRLGDRARRMRFETGGHVRAALVHRHRYWPRVEAFLADALAASEPSPGH